MIASSTIAAALLSTLKSTRLFDRVAAHSDADLAGAIEALRDAPASLCVIVAGTDEISHELTEGTNDPVFSEIRSHYELIATARNLDMRKTGDPAALPLKDAILARLLWDNLGIDGLLCLPTSAEPMAVQFSDGRGREAWKISLELRQIITG